MPENVGSAAIHVLLVEDNPGDVGIIRRMLIGSGAADRHDFQLTNVATLARGIDLLRQGGHDVVLLDLTLPDSTGLDTLAQVQSVAPSVPIVVLTGMADDDASLAAVQKGAQDYLVKGHVDQYALCNSIRYARERKQLLERLRGYSADLEARNSELDAFAHTVAHDLKNQVFAVAGNAELLLTSDCPDLPAQERAMLADILHAAQKMSTVIQDLLLLSQVRRTEVASAPIDMGLVLSEVRVRLWPLLAEYGDEVIAGEPEEWPVARGYAPWVEEVWYNYISNALKYGGHPPHVELGAVREGVDFVRFWVRDNGNGIPADRLDSLFVEFVRLNERRAAGHGLGLSIVKRIVEKLGGSVGVESKPGHGSTFSFTLPAAKPG